MDKDVKELIKDSADTMLNIAQINPNWVMFFNKFNKDDIKNFTLSPVGSYIGTRKLSKILGQDIPLSVFYKE